MPFVTIKLMEGRNLEQKRKMALNVTKAVAEACEIPVSRVHVFIEDMSSKSYGKGGMLVCDMNRNNDGIINDDVESSDDGEKKIRS
ncbi:MAG: hypothetical protein CVV64_10100 [Candidatus Wallbacteria bacterium HGW-Wallbacteria-1]|jgi:4-oxalocrotonate tautomerase|uniref:4-oxalocrotonate tautomerase-like domain-containing protein n=1 Tax=Candidatus Wallbacteria bacterium HGW-Wallbacteria-1 TaxID=2013854 RepID=A0A2N1PPP5_9BACT|nr:MAG: hypothetical protein CVV64_10100 [Candidatus Wallbacteria bacterium HGW-Wallbacteria-1]